jgi:ferredoxin-nitrate reductase
MITAVEKTHKSTCSYCGVGCGIIVHKNKNGKLTVEGDTEHPSNKGMLCSKGKNLHYVAMDKSDRLFYPKMRMARNLQLERVNWDDAIERVAKVFKTLIEKFGPNSVGFYVSGQCLTEEYYIVNKLTKGFIGTNNIDTNSRLCMSSAVVGYKQAFGEDSVPLTYEDIELADCFFVAGANPAWCHPILFRRIEDHKSKNPHVKLIIVDPRRTASCDIADLHIALKPGSDIFLFKGIARALIESNKIDKEFLEQHVDGHEDYITEVMRTSISEYAKECDIPESDIYFAADAIGDAKGFISLWAMGLNQSVIGVNKNLALLNLSLLTGKIGTPGNGPLSLTGQPNAMGGREVGGLSNLLPAHRELSNPEHRKEVANFWGVESVPEKPGLTATEMFSALESGEMKAIWIICTNPMVSLPDSAKFERALSKAKFVVVQDISDRSDTVQFADVVLPAAGWLEKEGTMTNSERRISYLNKVIDPPGEALSDVEILIRFAKKMNYHGFDFKNASEIYAEHCRLTKGTNIDISGLSYDVLKSKGTVQWPYPENATEGTARLFTDYKFYTPNKKARMKTMSSENQSETIDEKYPLILTTGRIRDQWHTMTKTGKVQKLNQHIDKPFVEIHPIDAKARMIVENDLLLIEGKRGNVRARARITDTIKSGVVFLPMHWGKILGTNSSRANNLTNPIVDPISKEPDFKFTAVQVSKYKKAKQKIVIIGAGAASYHFIKSYREKNQDDEIIVFSKEEIPFYNRVMLPEYVSGRMNWDGLLKSTSNEMDELNIKVYTGVSVEKIDRERKIVSSGDSISESYDVLILSMGSRPSMPKDLPKMSGIYNLRTRHDADSIMQSVSKDKQAIIVGGGLLGLELSASLHEIGVQVTVVQRASRLMDRQLDETASSLLEEELELRGIEVLLNEEIQTIRGQDTVMGVRLGSGRILDAKSIIYAVGTTPNIELAKNANLDCSRGVVIDDYLRSSDKNIFAMGEIAEFKNELYGITAAAEEQADTIVNFLLGDEYSFYTGSLSMNLLKIHGLNLCSIGIPSIPAVGIGYEEILFYDKASRYYKKCIVQNDKLVGAILMGDKSEFTEFKELISSKIELGEKRLELLRSGKPLKPMIGKLICSCNSVGDGNLLEEIKNGCTDFLQLCAKSGAGTGCGSCKPEVNSVLKKYLNDIK